MIVIDVSAAVHSRAGLGRYSQNLARALASLNPGQVSLFYNQGRDGRLPDDLSNLPKRQVRLGYKPWRMAVLLGQLLRLSFDRLVPEADLFHGTEHLLIPLVKIPTVLTVHDLIYRLFPDHHKRLNYWYLNLAMPLYCRRATAIIAVSQATKRDIVDHYGVDEAKIHVVHEAAAPHFRPPADATVQEVREKYSLPDRFLLHLGTIEPRKNLDRLVDSFQILHDQDDSLALILVGTKGWLYEGFFDRINDDGLQNCVRALGWVDDEDLPGVIAAASLAVQPSLYEGFGLPLLEHMACGQVVAASNSSSFPEIGGDAVATFTPTDVREMTQVINRLLSDKQEYHHRRELGLVQAAKFSWQRAANETMDVYEMLKTGTPLAGKPTA